MTTNFSGRNALASIAFSKVGRSKDCPIEKSCGTGSNASTRFTHFCNADELRSTDRVQRRSSDALMARGILVFLVPRLREHRWTGGANHNDVQSHGRKAPMVIQRSLRQNHGFLPHASRT